MFGEDVTCKVRTRGRGHRKAEGEGGGRRREKECQEVRSLRGLAAQLEDASAPMLDPVVYPFQLLCPVLPGLSPLRSPMPLLWVMQDELYFNGAVVLPHKEIKESVPTPAIIL